MEIDRAIRESDDGRLKTKYNNAVYVIQRALALYKFEEVAFSFNGGKDSTVLLHLLRAGYFMHKMRHDNSSGLPTELKLPLRTIYFETPSAFPEINSFTNETAETYGLQIEIIRLDFKSGLETLMIKKPTTAIFLGTRIGDPNAVGQEQFSPSSPGWPPFMRVNPILDWSYRDVWAFLRTCKVPYCTLYTMVTHPLEAYMTQFQMHCCVSVTPAINTFLNLRTNFQMRDWKEQVEPKNAVHLLPEMILL